MTTTKRGRGRPEDASLYRVADHAKLAQMADLIAQAPELKPTTAMTRIGITDVSTVRRLRRRWARYKARHLTDAQERLRARTPRPRREESTSGPTKVSNPAARERMSVPGDVVRMLDEYRVLGATGQLGAAFEAVKLATTSPGIFDRLRPYREIQNHPSVRAVVEALGPRPDFSAIKNAIGPRPDLGALHQLYKPGGALDTIRPGSAIGDMLRPISAVGDTLRRKP